MCNIIQGVNMFVKKKARIQQNSKNDMKKPKTVVTI